MFSFLAKVTGQFIGETVHQIGEVAKDISNIPSALMAGYEEELFTKEVPTDTTTTPKVETPDVANS